MPRNESPENTVMRDVPPGDETGIYHIIISGLPFGTIWQLLKDWLRQAGCDVDHIEVFQKSTSGWIRLIGRENFERALHHLQTVPYNNRLLLYLDKNRSEPVKIMELINDPPPKPKLGGNSYFARSKGNLRTSHDTALTSQIVQDRCWSRAAACVHHIADSAVADLLPDFSSAIRYRETLTDAPLLQDYTYNRAPATDSYPRSAWATSFSPILPGYHPCQQYDQTASLRKEQEPGINRPPRIDLTRNRSLKPLPRTAKPAEAFRCNHRTPRNNDDRFRVQIVLMKQGVTPKDVEEWARDSMGEWASAISHVDMTSDPQKGCSRGSGYVTFRSAAAARRAVELLNAKPFLGKPVRACLADDSAESGDPAEQGKQAAACDTKLAGHLVVDDSGGLEATPRDPAGNADAKHLQPVIAHGTNFYRPK